jgi:hypothetical protein
MKYVNGPQDRLINTVICKPTNPNDSIQVKANFQQLSDQITIKMWVTVPFSHHLTVIRQNGYRQFKDTSYHALEKTEKTYQNFA